MKSKPAGQTCAVYQRPTGTVPAAGLGVKVGCEFNDEHVVRSADNNMRGTFFDSHTPMVGGGREPIGSNPLAFGEGRFVAFVSSAAGLPGSAGDFRQVYFRDRLTGKTSLVSVTAAGAAAVARL